MKKIVIDDSIPFLCEDIIRNILNRLPAKSLIRFQCVCKHWKNLIKSPSFIADHFHNSTHQNPCLLFQPLDSKSTLNLHLLDRKMEVRQVSNHPLIDYLKLGCVVGSSNGLLCIDISKDGISDPSLLLCNPAIREIRQVPTTYTDFYGSLGFGFSPTVNDYKIVKIYANMMMFNDLVAKVEVYSLRTGSWNEVELGVLDGAIIFICFSNFTANGAIYWFGFKLKEEDEIGYIVGGNGYDVIISFDIATEVFTLIPMPTSVPRSHLNRLTTYGNKLAMLSHCGVGNSRTAIDLWVMEEGGAASGKRWSWTKKYTSNPYPCFLTPMTIWRNEIVCINATGSDEMENDEPNTVLVNLNTKKFTDFAVSGSRFGHRIFNYVESLIPVGGMELSAKFV